MNAKHLIIVPHTHWDREWYMPFERFRKRLVSMIDRLLDVLESDPNFPCFELDGQTIVLDDYLEIRPENRQRLEKLIRRGRILIGPWYVQPDEFLVTGESIIRNLRLGIRSARRYGKVSLVGYLPDQFGHIAQMPQILANFGIRSAVVWRGVGQSVNETQFLWESPDGTRLHTVYLADSYGNGAFLPVEPKELASRLVRLMERLAPFSTIGSMLIMNGLDHLEPQEGLPRQLERAAHLLDGVTYEMGSLGGFIRRAKKQARSLPVHSGEFRSPKRSPLLPGVTSARIAQKQRAFECCALLEKYVEPLSAWALLCGDARPYRNFIEHGWRQLLQNQPHDSICGCSVDQVHEEMETRFDRSEQLGKALLKDALSFLANQAHTRWAPAELPVLCVFNPTLARHQLVDVEVDLEEPEFIESLRDSDGRVIPVQKEVGERELFLQTEDTPEAIRQLVSGMENRELIGYYINNVLWRMDGEVLRLKLIMGRAPAGEVDFKRRREELLAALEDPQIKKVQVQGVSGARTRIRFSADNLAPVGLTPFSLSGERAADASRNSLRASVNGLENAYYLISIQGDGTLTIVDKQLGKQFHRCLHMVDEADRGDTYNFDEVPGGELVDAPTSPVRVSVVDDGPVRAAVQVEGTYRIPQSLTADRTARSAAAVETPIKAVISLYEGIKRVDFRISFENECEDHRLRVFFSAPFAAAEAIVDSTFGAVRRSTTVDAGEGFIEKPVGASPQKCFTCIEDGSAGMAVFNRGIPEVEAVRAGTATSLALTLLRSVGWLSRDDLVSRPVAAGPQFQTPGAQSKGRHDFEFAFTSYAGGFADAEIVKRAHAYAFPPDAAVTNSHKGTLGQADSLVALENGNIVVSAVEPVREQGAFLVRMYNATGRPQRASVSLWRARSVHEVNFLGRKLSKEPLRLRGKKAAVSFKPGEIKTLLVLVK